MWEAGQAWWIFTHSWSGLCPVVADLRGSVLQGLDPDSPLSSTVSTGASEAPDGLPAVPPDPTGALLMASACPAWHSPLPALIG